MTTHVSGRVGVSPAGFRVARKQSLALRFSLGPVRNGRDAIAGGRSAHPTRE
jgi:hypothetical protein